MHVLCLQVAIAAGDNPSSNLMLYSGGYLFLQWAATTKHILAVQPSSTAIQRGLNLATSRYMVVLCSLRKRGVRKRE